MYKKHRSSQEMYVRTKDGRTCFPKEKGKEKRNCNELGMGWDLRLTFKLLTYRENSPYL